MMSLSIGVILYVYSYGVGVFTESEYMTQEEQQQDRVERIEYTKKCGSFPRNPPFPQLQFSREKIPANFISLAMPSAILC